MQRQNLVLFSGAALGLTIAGAIPVAGRFFPGMGKGGGLALALITVAAVLATPVQHRFKTVIVSIFCWAVFVLSAMHGGS